MHPYSQAAHAQVATPHRPQLQVSATDAIAGAWEHFKRNAGLMLLGGTLYTLAIFVPSYLPTVLAMGRVFSISSVEFHVTSLVFEVIATLSSTYLFLGISRFGLASVKGETPGIGHLFGFRGLGRLFVLYMLLNTISFLGTTVSIVAAAIDVTELHVLAGALAFLSLAVLAVAWPFISMTPLFILDKDLSIVQAIRASLDVTRGNRLNIFAAGFLAGLLMFAGVFACGIGLFATMPLGTLVFVVIYARLTGQDAGEAQRYAGYGQPAYAAGSPGTSSGAFGSEPPPAGGFGGASPPGY